MGDAIRHYREAQGRKRQECADAIDVHVVTWKRWELGYLAPSSANLLRIARCLGVPAEALAASSVSKRAGTARTAPAA